VILRSIVCIQVRRDHGVFRVHRFSHLRQCSGVPSWCDAADEGAYETEQSLFFIWLYIRDTVMASHTEAEAWRMSDEARRIRGVVASTGRAVLHDLEIQNQEYDRLSFEMLHKAESDRQNPRSIDNLSTPPPVGDEVESPSSTHFLLNLLSIFLTFHPSRPNKKKETPLQ